MTCYLGITSQYQCYTLLVTRSIMERKGLNPILMAQKMRIESFDKDTQISNKMLLGQIIVMKGKHMLVALIVFNMPNFNMILGIDFLGMYEVEINYQRKKVQFSLKDGDEFIFSEGQIQSMIINYIKAYKMLCKGCTSYLAHVVSKNNGSSLKIKSMLVVQDYQDVFPNEITRLASKREVDFSMELVSSITLISKELYRAISIEIQKLKKQESLDNGFIRPSCSSWGASIMFIKKKDESLMMCIDYQELTRYYK